MVEDNSKVNSKIFYNCINTCHFCAFAPYTVEGRSVKDKINT